MSISAKLTRTSLRCSFPRAHGVPVVIHENLRDAQEGRAADAGRVVNLEILNGDGGRGQPDVHFPDLHVHPRFRAQPALHNLFDNRVEEQNRRHEQHHREDEQIERPPGQSLINLNIQLPTG